LEESQEEIKLLLGSEKGLESGIRIPGEERGLGEAKAAGTIQKALRGYVKRKNFTWQKLATMQIQALMRGHQVWKKGRQQTLERELNRETTTGNRVKDKR
jgi:hypothetical protein